MPWSHARQWHSALWAVKDYADRVDRVADLQRAVMDDQSREIQTLRRQVRQLTTRMSKMIPLHIADQAVAACESEIQLLREKVETLEKIIRRERELLADVQTENLILHKNVAQWKERYEGTTEAKLGREIYGIPKEGKQS